MSTTITVEYHRSTPMQSLYGYNLKVVVVNAVDMPKEIFMYQRGAGTAPTVDEPVRDNFVGIADPVDLQEIPPLAPELLNSIPYYRTSEVVLGFRSIIDLESTETDIRDDIRGLITSLRAMEDYSSVGTVTETYPEV
jgi:hypothetical protein